MNNVLIFTGAGLSAESGLSTFRTENGTWTRELGSAQPTSYLWDNFDPKKLASLDALATNRDLVFEFYNRRRNELAEVQPNAAHVALARLQQTWGRERVQLFTQNGDNLLSRAGALEVHHVHGKLTDLLCLKCSHTWDIGYQVASAATCCPACRSPNTKPGVIFFGENASLYALMDATFKNSLQDLIIVIGTTGLVVPFKRIVGNRHHPRRSYTILNNLHREDGVNYRKWFDETLFQPVTQALPYLKEKASAFLNLKSAT